MTTDEMRVEQRRLAQAVHDALQTAVAANEALLAFELALPFEGPRMAFAPLNADQFSRWRAGLGEIDRGERTGSAL